MPFTAFFFLLMFTMFGVALVIGYFILRAFGLAIDTKTHEEDRVKIEELGTERIEYSNPYFAKLAQGASVGDNLPTRSCDKCGAALNPEDRYCNICGVEIV